MQRKSRIPLIKTKLIDYAPQVAEMHNIPTLIVRDILKFVHTFTLQWLRNPTKVVYSIPYLGRIERRFGKIDFRLKKFIIPQLRKNRTPELLEEFRKLWKIRKYLREKHLEYYYTAKQIKELRIKNDKSKSDKREEGI